MRHPRLPFWIFLTFVPLLPVASGCEALLKQGVFEVTKFDSKRTFSENYKSFIDRITESSAREAQGVGLAVLVPIEGIPVALEANFSEEQFNTWKERVKELKEWSISESEAEALYKTTVSRVLVEGYLECRRIESEAFGLRVTIGGDDKWVVLVVKWRPTGGDKLEVTSFKVNDVEKSMELPALAPDSSSTLIFPRENPASAVVVVLNGEADGKQHSKSVNLPGFVAYRVAGEQDLTGQNELVANRLIFENGSVLKVGGGRQFTFSVDEIVVLGSAVVDASGKQGKSGRKGERNPNEPWFSNRTRGGHDQYWAARRGVEANPKHPDRGGKGGQGEDGEKGTDLKFTRRIPLPPSLEIRRTGGAPGEGGPGGDGRRLCCGEHTNPEMNSSCVGGIVDFAGEKGDPGSHPGEKGNLIWPD